MATLLTAREVDVILRYPAGRTAKLAKAGKIPFITLPDGEMRFAQEVIDRIVNPPATAPIQEGSNAR